MKFSELKLEKKILVLGSSGSGKTFLIGTLCQSLPTLVVTSDKEGLETLRQFDIDPEVLIIEDWRRCWDYYEQIKASAQNCLALALDDFGSMQHVSKMKVERMPLGKEEEKKYRLNPDEFILGIRRELMLGERRMQIQQWGELWLACESFLYEVLALPFVIKLVTVLEGVVENPRNNQMHIYPNLLGQIRTTLPARFSIVAQSFVADFEGKRYHCLSSHSHPKIESKDRYGKGRTWLDPKMANILQYMEGKAKEETELEKKIGIGL